MALKFTSALLALFASVATAVNPVVVRGSDFVDSVTNNRFQVIGMAYQPGGSAGYDPDSNRDPLSNAEVCLRDAIIMQGLGINTIRVYNLSPTINHDDCAAIFNAAGIYMLIDVNSPLPNESLNAELPWTSYHEGYLERVFQILENFMNYDNLLGFFSANEVINNMETGEFTPQYIRAVTRDIKTYLHARNRPIPVGYSAADVREILVDSFQYMQCSLEDDEDDMSKVDFFGINSYSWCGSKATYQSSGFSDLVRDFSETTVPIFFSEFGCNEVDPRTWTEIRAIYGEDMSRVFSGGVVYEYTQEDNDYGLVELDGNTASLLDDFDYLQSELARIDTERLVAQNSTATSLTPPRCSPELIEDDDFQSNFTLPNVPEGVSEMIENGVTGGATGTLQAYSSPTAMPQRYRIEGSGGDRITGLRLRILMRGQSNLPNNESTVPNEGGQGRPSSTLGGSSGGDSDEGAASGLKVQASMVALVAGLMAMFLM